MDVTDCLNTGTNGSIKKSLLCDVLSGVVVVSGTFSALTGIVTFFSRVSYRHHPERNQRSDPTRHFAKARQWSNAHTSVIGEVAWVLVLFQSNSSLLYPFILLIHFSKCFLVFFVAVLLREGSCEVR